MTIEVREEARLFDRPLRRSRRERIIGGVCGGIAQWLEWDATLVRVLFVLFAILSSPVVGLVAYGVLWLVVPERRYPRYTLYNRRVWDELERL